MQVTETLSEGLKREFKVVVGASELEPGDVLDTDGNLEQTLVQALGREVKRTADRPGAVCRRDVEADRLLRSAELPQPPR